MSAPLRIGSLFSGIDGLSLGLERGIGNGAHTVFQVEQNAYCRAVLAKHWPDALRFDDVRTVGRHNLPGCDVLCAGYPCQPYSLAGNREGADDERALWPECGRIIRELGPKYVTLENVAAHLSLGFGDVLRDLAALGYDAEWSVLRAASLGAPHGRDRLIALAYPSSARGPRLVQSANLGQAGPWRLRGASDMQLIANAPFERGDRWPQPLVRRVDDGLSHRMDRLRALGNSVVPQVAEVVGRLIAEREALRSAA